MTTVRKFAVGVASVALVASAAAPAFAGTGSEKPYPLSGSWDRIASDRPNNDRVDTAIAVAQKEFGDTTDHAHAREISEAKAVYVASSTALIDAAPTGQLTDGPVLLVDSNPRTLDVVKAEIARYTSAKTVYAIGGTAVVSDETLKSVAGDKATGRLGGEDRYGTAMAVAKRVIEVKPSLAKAIILSRPDNPIDALAAGTLDEGPLFYIKDGKLPEEVAKWIETNKVEKVFGLGGKDAVPDAALTDATASAIRVNPSDVDKEYLQAIKDFKAARDLYLGVNNYASDLALTPTPNDTYPLATGRSPKLLNLLRQDAAERFEGYKALNEETQSRLATINQAVAYWKTQIADAIKDARDTDVAAWSAFSTNSTLGLGSTGKVYVALEELYGNTFTGLVTGGNNTIENVKKYFSFDGDVANKKVSGFDYAAFERDVKAFNTEKDNDKALITKYFANPDTNLADGTEADNLWSSGTIADLTKADNDRKLVLLKADAQLFADTAAANAAITKANMEAAYAKISIGQDYVRLGGADRYETAAMISRYERSEAGWKPFTAVYLANGESMVDALVAGTLSNGPILLVNSAGNLTEATKTELQQIGQYAKVSRTSATEREKGKVPTLWAVGGTKAVADATASAAANEIKAGNNKVTVATTDLLITKNPTVGGTGVDVSSVSGATVSKAAGKTAGKELTVSASYQKDSSYPASTNPTVKWQRSTDGTTWTDVADGTPTGAAYTYSADKTTMTIKGAADTADDSGKIVATQYRMVVTYASSTGVVEKQVASSGVTVGVIIE